MNTTTIATQTLWTQIIDWFSTPSLQLFLLCGSAGLAISILILSLTRLGHARPVMKCVILSVAAHILLIGYAYGTRLILRPTAAVVAEPEPVQLVGYDVELDEPNETPQSDPIHPWDDFSNAQPSLDMDSLARPSLDSPVTLDRPTDSEALTPPLESPIQEFEPEISQVTQVESPRFDAAPLDSVPGFESENDIEMESPELQAEKISFQRRKQDLATPMADADIAPTPVLENQHSEMPPIVPEDFKTERNALVDSNNSTEQFESEFVTPKADLPAVEEFLPARMAPKRQPEISKATNSFRSPKSGMRKINLPRRLGDGQPIPKLYRLRTTNNIQRTAVKRGGSADTQRSVELALQWLADHQRSNGGWDPRDTGAGVETQTLGHNRNGAGAQADTGITALAALALLGAGNTHLEGNYQKNVQSALEFLIRSQSEDGNLAGEAKLFARMYCHSMALLALSEALAVTGDKRLAPAVEKGVEYTLRSQNAIDGGWRYQPGDRGDMSQFGWQVMALHSASIGGVTIPQKTIERMHMFLELCCSGQDRGLASYRPGQGVSTTMTAEALLCRFFMEKKVDPKTIAQAGKKIGTEIPSMNTVNLYYWYYGTMAMYHSGGDSWNRWNDSLKETLLPMQIQSGRDKGSWPNNGPWGGYGGRVYSTAMATLCLEVYYRYLPIYEIAKDD